MDGDDLAKETIRIQGELESERSNWDNHWREVAERVLPHENNFNIKRQGGEKLMDKVFDSTAILALSKFSAAVTSIVAPSTQMWHGLEAEDESLRDDLEVKIYLEDVAKLLFKIRYRPFGNFTSQLDECHVNLGAFGTDCMYTEDVLGLGIRYTSIPMTEIYIRQSHLGMVDYMHRKFEYDIRQIVQKFGEKGLPAGLVAYKDKDLSHKFEVIHCVKPNEEMRRGDKRTRGMRYASYYVMKEFCHTLSVGGYRTFPYSVGRYITSSKEKYGRSPAMLVLPDIKMLNEMEKTMLRGAHKQVDPPLLAYGDGILAAFSARPNAINYGGVNERGEQLIHPLQTGARLPIGLEMTDQKRKVVNDAFLVTLFQILVENPQMTATEALLRAQEKGELLAPTMGRQQSDFLGPMISRELDILAAANVIPQPPEQLAQTGNRVRAVYTSPLSRLRRAGDGVAIIRTFESIKPMAELDPTVLDSFDMDAAAREISDINGVPAKILRPFEEVMQIRAKRQADQEAAAEAEQAKLAMGAVKDGAQAMNMMGEMPAMEGAPA